MTGEGGRGKNEIEVWEGADGRRIGRMGEWDRWEENGTDNRRGREREERGKNEIEGSGAVVCRDVRRVGCWWGYWCVDVCDFCEWFGGKGDWGWGEGKGPDS